MSLRDEMKDLGALEPASGEPAPETAYNRVWFNLQRIQRSMGLRIARALRTAGLEDPLWYELLRELDHVDAEGLPMAEVEARLVIQQYALSRHVKRLEALGWISRHPRPGPGRGQSLKLTDAGRRVHAQVRRSFEQILHQELAHRMSPADADALARQLIHLHP